MHQILTKWIIKVFFAWVNVNAKWRQTDGLEHLSALWCIFSIWQVINKSIVWDSKTLYQTIHTADNSCHPFYIILPEYKMHKKPCKKTFTKRIMKWLVNLSKSVIFISYEFYRQISMFTFFRKKTEAKHTEP